jgi:hydroxymethylpyrimidine pyrophosphatase-like HAD family hydrolase
MSRSILLCTDLDRTLLPNGLQAESPEARPLFRSVAAHPEVTIAYVSGRSLDLQREAIQRWSLPMPGYAIADVGTTPMDTGTWSMRGMRISRSTGGICAAMTWRRCSANRHRSGCRSPNTSMTSN